MNSLDVLKKPVLTEKAYSQQDKRNVYTFVVDKRANKLEIKEAVEQFYSVSVIKVNTLVMPKKTKSRYTKAGYISGYKSSFKKAMITLAEGDNIDIFA